MTWNGFSWGCNGEYHVSTLSLAQSWNGGLPWQDPGEKEMIQKLTTSTLCTSPSTSVATCPLRKGGGTSGNPGRKVKRHHLCWKFTQILALNTAPPAKALASKKASTHASTCKVCIFLCHFDVISTFQPTNSPVFAALPITTPIKTCPPECSPLMTWPMTSMRPQHRDNGYGPPPSKVRSPSSSPDPRWNQCMGSTFRLKKTQTHRPQRQNLYSIFGNQRKSAFKTWVFSPFSPNVFIPKKKSSNVKAPPFTKYLPVSQLPQFFGGGPPCGWPHL